MGFREPQTPGIGGIDELTSTEELWVQTGAAGVLKLLETTAPSAVAANGLLYVKSSDHLLYYKNASGTEFSIGSGGTVTSVSVTTAAGVSGTVATATTTPAITITLGAITPTSVAASGTVTGSNLSGTNTGDQTISDATITTTDITTNNFTTAKHGFVPKGTNVGSFLKDDGTWAAVPGGGDALTTNPLSQFAATTSLQLKGVISDETGSGALVFGTTPTLATPVINGLPTGTGIASAATASTVAARDANANLLANNWLAGYTTTATAAGTTTLTVGSTYAQFFTGSTTQTVTLPVASTLSLGHQFLIVNNSTGAVTINSSGANAVVILAGSTSVVVTCILASGTNAASWSYSYNGVITASGKVLTASNTITLAGTDGTTMTFPSTSATIARTDAANTFTGHQTIEGVTSTGATGTGKLVFDGTPTLVTPVLGTPTSGTLTNCTGLPIAGLTASTSTALGVGTIELGHATDTTIARSGAGAITVEGVQVILSGAALGTPSSGTLTNATGLPVAGITASTSTALGVGSIELGHATDTTLSRNAAGVLQVEGVVIPSISSTNTLTNKRVTKRGGTTTSSGTPTINTDNVDIYTLSAQSAAITSFTTNLTGTPTVGQTLWIGITDNGTARAITWGTSFEASGTVALPTTTVISTRLDVGFVWNDATSKWRCVATA